ncbi:MAG: N-6 DNA methylase [Bacteroidetes bacterium]|jgi:hypothetical protein|nr:N-6 DNA methylase [Bacteroidota bacterium]MBT7143634.1 N-6 DNA methylase [Bacteroidota bacterium]
MSLFQKSVEKKYLNDLDSTLIDKKYADFQDYFGNPERQENIRNSKEEQFQEGFLRELFVNILGYTLNPEPNFNLTTELKNISNSKKADGAILKGKEATAIIELKGTNTTDLDKIETQAFGYKNHHPKCIYVITSNFEKLRFYIQNAVDHIDFDLFKLTKDQFALMWLCLAKDNLLNDLPLKIKDSSVLQEKTITKKLYADYSKFRNDLFENIKQNNPEKDKLLVFKKVQKLLDRFLFIFFAEDRQLLPPNSISEIIKQWKQQADWGDDVRLYDRYTKYFHLLNTGWKGKKHEIFAYNGGLFAPDDVLDSLKIDDDVLDQNTLTLSGYNFNPELIDNSKHENVIDVNILGHIFEHSLSEIENVQAEIAATSEHAPMSKQETVSKRKKDGIFYTPKYITKYIVENTLGKLCNEKRTELQIIDEDFAKGRKNRKKDTIKSLIKKLDDYRSWLLTLTILDPACGSGAFLNQALEFLIIEHQKIDELRAQLLGGGLVFSDITTDILEKNIYGVDLNEESVEIAKLSLWLRTAQKGRKLNTLSNNIKCGNSLIDDPKIAGDKAFNWQNEFSNIFKKKEKKAWHITTATHNSRYSQRMFDNYVKLGEPVWLSEKEEIIVTETIAEIAEKDKLNIVDYNICGDHAHILLVCEKEELPKIVQKIKAMSARACNIAMGRTIPRTSEHATIHPDKDIPATLEHAPAHSAGKTVENGEHAPHRGKTQFHLWTKKFNQNEITSTEQFDNTIAYIKNNRQKHQLPENKELQTLIDKICCTHNHAFRTEYTGGFDVVIGNPPYVQSHSISESEKEFIYKEFKTVEYQINTYGVFVEQFIKLLKINSFYSLIIPNYWLSTKFDRLLRKNVFIENHAIEVINTYEVFESATVDTLILTGQKVKNTNPKTSFYSISKNCKTIEERLNAINLRIWEYSEEKQFANGDEENTISFNKELKLSGNRTLGEFFSMFQGMKPYEKGKGNPPQTREMMNEKVYHSKTKIDETYFPLLGAKHIHRHFLVPFTEYIKYGKNLAAPRKPEIFEGERILINRILSKNKIDGILLSETYINNTDVFNLIPLEKNVISIKVLYALVVSKLCATYFKRANVNLNRNAFPKINVNTLEAFPIPEILPEIQTQIELQINTIISKTLEFQKRKSKFIELVKDNLAITIISKKTDAFYDFDFKSFLSELKKQKVTLSLSDQSEWKDFFESTKSEINQIQSEIEKTDKEIDQMVYELYSLSDEEIKIIETV